MTAYRSGRDFEYAVRDRLTADGYEVIRSAGSKTPVDLVAFKAGEILFVQCKRDGRIGPAARADLINRAALVDAVPLVALKGPRGTPVEWRRLTDRGPADFEPWTPDEIGACDGSARR